MFNDEETITGYRELNIDIFLTPVQLRPYVNITFEKKQKKADELEKPLKGLFVGGKFIISHIYYYSFLYIYIYISPKCRFHYQTGGVSKVVGGRKKIKTCR